MEIRQGKLPSNTNEHTGLTEKLNQLEVSNDTYLFIESDGRKWQVQGIRNHASIRGQATGKKFAVRKLPDGIGVWRIK